MAAPKVAPRADLKVVSRVALTAETRAVQTAGLKADSMADHSASS
jgi:hypothetical protein